MNAPTAAQRETRHAFRVPLDAWNASLGFRFALSYAPRAKRAARYNRCATNVTFTVEGVGARRVRWHLEGEHLVTHTARGGALVKYLRALSAQWPDARHLAEADDVRCRKCLLWTDAECTICNHCGGVA